MLVLRLGLQVIEFLTTGRITLPIPSPDRAYLRSIRRGLRSLDEFVVQVADAKRTSRPESRLAAKSG
jgi:hypothetical protein